MGDHDVVVGATGRDDCCADFSVSRRADLEEEEAFEVESGWRGVCGVVQCLALSVWMQERFKICELYLSLFFEHLN